MAVKETTAPVKLERRLFTVEEYYWLAEAGILAEDDRVELIEGEIVTMAAIGPSHASTVTRLNRFFTRQVGEEAIVSVQSPIRLSQHTEPEPDIALLQFRSDFYSQAHPGPGDILLVVEVAVTSLDYDRDVKLPLYAQAGIAEVWIVNMHEDSIEVYRDPSPSGYLKIRRVLPGSKLSPQAFPDVELEADAILG